MGSTLEHFEVSWQSLETRSMPHLEIKEKKNYHYYHYYCYMYLLSPQMLSNVVSFFFLSQTQLDQRAPVELVESR